MQTLFKPLKYKIPTLPEYLANWQGYKHELRLAPIGDENQISRFPDPRRFVDNTNLHLSSWERIIEDFYHDDHFLLKDGKNKKVRDRWLEADDYFKNPFVYFFQTTAFPRPIRQNKQIFESSTFNSLFLEITRDNIITETERAFLREKAMDYKIDWPTVEKALEEENPATHSLTNFVIEVCRDGIITPAEKKFLNEKAAIYNLSEELLNTLIARHLTASKIFNEFREEELFYDLVIQKLLILFVSQDNEHKSRTFSFGEEIFDESNRSQRKKFFVDEIKLGSGLFIRALEAKLGHALKQELTNLSIVEWVNELGFTALNHTQSLKKHDQQDTPDGWIEESIDYSEPISSRTSTLNETLEFNGFRYNFKETSNSQQLFDYNVRGTHVSVKVALSHPLFPKNDQKAFFRFLTTLISAKIQDDRIAIDDYFDSFFFLQSKISKDFAQ